MRLLNPLFDDLFARGIAGTFDEVLADIKSTEGMGIDIETKLFDQLGRRCVLGRLTLAQPSVTNDSYVCLEILPDQVEHVVAVIEQLIEDDPGLVTTQSDGLKHDLWSFAPTKQPKSGDAVHSGITILGNWLIYADDNQVVESLRQAFRRSSDLQKTATYQLKTRAGETLEIGGVVATESTSSSKARDDVLSPFFEGVSLDFSRVLGSGSPTIIMDQFAQNLGLSEGQTFIRGEPLGWFFVSDNQAQPGSKQ